MDVVITITFCLNVVNVVHVWAQPCFNRTVLLITFFFPRLHLCVFVDDTLLMLDELGVNS